MGCIKNITADNFPKQSKNIGRMFRLCFNYNTRATVLAKCIRDDTEEPGRMIFIDEENRVILSTECQYQPYR